MSTSHRGYTLLELIVAVGIFSIVMLAATGAYLSLIRLDREARATNDVVNNLSFAVDSMARAIRTGTQYKCNNSVASPNCTDIPGGSSLGFQDSSGRAIVYSLSNNQLMASVNGVSFPMTDPRVSIDTLSFYVRGVGTSTAALKALEPTVTFVMKGSMTTTSGTTRTFTLQSGATQRYLEL